MSTLSTNFDQSGLAVFNYTQLRIAICMLEPVIIVAECLNFDRCLEIERELTNPLSVEVI